MKPKYQTTILNDEGLTGTVKVSNGHDFVTSHPSSNDENNNPEQFMGAALATCLNATLEFMINQNELPMTSKVESTVQQFPDTKGYFFKIDTKVTITGASTKQAEEMLEEAESRCPVAKLLAGNSNITVHL